MQNILSTFWPLDGKCTSPEVSRGDLDRVSEVEKGTPLKFLLPFQGPLCRGGDTAGVALGVETSRDVNSSIDFSSRPASVWLVFHTICLQHIPNKTACLLLFLHMLPRCICCVQQFSEPSSVEGCLTRVSKMVPLSFQCNSEFFL